MKLQNCHGNLPYVLVSTVCQDGDEVLNTVNEDVRAQKDAFENLNTQENIEKVFCRNSLKNSELYKPNLRSKHLKE